jgi:hypothetical protein
MGLHSVLEIDENNTLPKNIVSEFHNMVGKEKEQMISERKKKIRCHTRNKNQTDVRPLYLTLASRR